MISFFAFFFRDASIHRLSILQLSDYRYKHRSNQPTTILEQFLRGRGSQTAISLLVKGPYRDFGDLHWQFTLLPLTNIIGQLLYAFEFNHFGSILIFHIFFELQVGRVWELFIRRMVDGQLSAYFDPTICSPVEFVVSTQHLLT